MSSVSCQAARAASIFVTLNVVQPAVQRAVSCRSTSIATLNCPPERDHVTGRARADAVVRPGIEGSGPLGHEVVVLVDGRAPSNRLFKDRTTHCRNLRSLAMFGIDDRRMVSMPYTFKSARIVALLLLAGTSQTFAAYAVAFDPASGRGRNNRRPAELRPCRVLRAFAAAAPRCSRRRGSGRSTRAV